MNASANPRSVTRATLWTIADFVADRGVNFAIIAVLARLLSPGEYGTTALLAVFVALATVMAESGLGMALIQKPELEEADRSSAFWINIALALVMMGALWAAGPLIALFFGEPVLVPLVQILALGIPLGALGTVQRSLLLRELAYKKLMIVRSAATLTSGLAAITLAVAGYGVYALAWQTCLLAVASSAGLWIASSWRPRPLFDRQAARRLFGFGGYMLASTILDTVYSRAYTVFIGKMGSPSTVGNYGRADATITLVQGLIAHPLNQLALPILSRMANDDKALGEGLRAGLKASMLVNAPAMLMLAVLAEPLLLLAYGPQWGGAEPFVQILALGGVLMPVHILNLRALMAKGRSNIFFWLEVAKKAVGLAALFIGAQWGGIGVAWGALAGGIIAAVINSFLSQRMFGYGTMAQARDIVLPIALGAAMAALAHAVLVIPAVEDLNPFARLMIGSVAGGAIWIVAVLAFNPSDFRDLAWSAADKVLKRKVNQS